MEKKAKMTGQDNTVELYIYIYIYTFLLVPLLAYFQSMKDHCSGAGFLGGPFCFSIMFTS